jgi:hypothetical protein
MNKPLDCGEKVVSVTLIAAIEANLASLCYCEPRIKITALQATLALSSGLALPHPNMLDEHV